MGGGEERNRSTKKDGTGMKEGETKGGPMGRRYIGGK